MIKIKLSRKNHESPTTAYTLVKIDGSHRFRLPAGPWRAAEDPTRLAAYDVVMANVRRVIEAKWRAVDHDPEIRAEIVTPAPYGMTVPHGDVLLVLDTLTAAGLTNVSLEGTPSPLLAARARK